MSLAVAGNACVPEELLESRLGRAAFHVWNVLIDRRARDGRTHVTRRGIANAAGFVPIHEDSVKKALVRLVAAGLVENIGWRWSRVAAGAGTANYKVFWRRVRGARMVALREGQHDVAVPAAVAAWVRAGAAWGGSRTGAGRPPKNQVSPTDQAAEDTVPKSRNRIQVSPTPPNSSIPTDRYLSSSYISGTLSLPSEEKPTASAAGVVRVFQEGIGHVFGGTSRAPLLPEGMPPYPGPGVIDAPRVPPPPKILATDPDDYRVRLLMNAFVAAIEVEYKLRKRAKRREFTSGKSLDAKTRKMLLGSARLLEQFGVAPAAWCVFAVRRWLLAREHTDGNVDMHPPLGVVFSERMISDQCTDQERRSVATECALGGRVIFGASYRKLGRRYQAMQTALLHGATLADALAEFFPGNLYDELVEAARIECAETQYRLDRDVRAGRFVWR